MSNRRLVWFGNFEFGKFIKEKDRHECALIHDIKAKLMLEDGEEEHFLCQYDAYLIPSEFNGEVYFSKQFIRKGIQ